MTQEGTGSGPNLQDDLYQKARRDGRAVTIYLLGGVRLVGRIRGFDRYTVLLESKDQDQLIYKHAISTVTFGRLRTESPPERRADP